MSSLCSRVTEPTQRQILHDVPALLRAPGGVGSPVAPVAGEIAGGCRASPVAAAGEAVYATGRDRGDGSPADENRAASGERCSEATGVAMTGENGLRAAFDAVIGLSLRHGYFVGEERA
ncbi:MAG: hypothetical protein LBE50_03875 [Gallionellaceae bacterium]|jgi:hypothetical protein|nr:hypothetical protein [Gallionellaceae bacterium]